MLRKIIFAVAVLAIGLTGCSKKSLVTKKDPTDPRDKGAPTKPTTPVTPPATAPQFTVDYSSILGNWQLVGMTAKDSNTETPVDEGVSHVFTFDAEYSMTYQTIYDGGYSDSGWYQLEGDNGNDLVVHFSSGTMTSYGATMTSADDLILPDANPEQSTIKSRHYKRISDENRDYLFESYGVNR